MRILIVEDSKQIATALKSGLKDHYAVDIAEDGKSAVELSTNFDYDTILLDLNLPKLSGEEVCKQLREKGVTSPIIVITGKDSEEDTINLLDLGADDYIVKPYKLQEVLARIRAALRRSTEAATAVIEAGDLMLDPATRLVSRSGKEIQLRKKEFELLEYFMRNPNRTLTRPMIIEHIWDMTENLWANVIDVHIKHLRDKVDRPFSDNDPLIKTVHGVGYKLEVPKVVEN